jgi:biopolymer transport protein ExbB
MSVRKIILWAVTVFFIIYGIWWITFFFIMGNNISFAFTGMALAGGAKILEEGEFDTENASGLGVAGAILARGGGLVDFLVFLFFLTLTFIIERWFYFFFARGRFNEVRLMKDIRENVLKNNFDAALDACSKQKGVIGRVMASGIGRYKDIKGKFDAQLIKSEVQAALDEQNAMEGSLLERGLIAVATIASIATMAGLLGTVVGMIRAFSALSAKGRPDPNQLATGISEALINTACGLTVAIISIVGYNYYLSKIDKFNFVTEESSAELINLISEKEAKI